MALVRYKPNRRGIRDLLGSTGVALDLLRRAEAVAVAAQAAYDADPPHTGRVEVEVDAHVGKPGRRAYRARAAVIAQHPAALHIEDDRRVLGGAVDAAA